MTMFPIDIDFSRIKEVLTYDPQAPMIFSSGTVSYTHLTLPTILLV